VIIGLFVGLAVWFALIVGVVWMTLRERATAEKRAERL
jgi:hypothetical protein